jgi:predicted phage terminase large subunit-like protein
MSELTRKNVWDWYTGTAYNRLMPGGSIVVINHRMHEDDLCGRLLAQQAAGGDQWEVVELPAINEAGEALWPDAYPIEALERIRKNTQPRFWSALFQQQPAPEEGDYFKADWLRPYEKVPDPKTLRVYGGSDYAVTADGGDFTCHAVVGLDPEGRMYLLDLWRKQAASDVWVEAFCDLVVKWKPVGWAEEQGQIKSGVGPFLDRRQRERRAYVVREQFPTRGDKAVRAQSIRGRMALEGLYVPISAAWYPGLRSELLSFPAGKHDDQVDALGLVGQLLDKMLAGSKPKPMQPVLRDRWDRVESSDADWKTI